MPGKSLHLMIMAMMLKYLTIEKNLIIHLLSFLNWKGSMKNSKQMKLVLWGWDVSSILLCLETYEACPEYDNIREIIHRFFDRINTVMKKTSNGYFWHQKAKKDEPEQAVMELLLFDLNKSIVCNQSPLHSGSVDHISMKSASDTYCKLCFIDHDGSNKLLRDMTKVHAIMVYCFRAIIHSIFYFFRRKGCSTWTKVRHMK